MATAVAIDEVGPAAVAATVGQRRRRQPAGVAEGVGQAGRFEQRLPVLEHGRLTLGDAELHEDVDPLAGFVARDPLERQLVPADGFVRSQPGERLIAGGAGDPSDHGGVGARPGRDEVGGELRQVRAGLLSVQLLDRLGDAEVETLQAGRREALDQQR